MLDPCDRRVVRCVRRYVIVTSGNSLAAAADTLADERVEIFKLPSDQKLVG